MWGNWMLMLEAINTHCIENSDAKILSFDDPRNMTVGFFDRTHGKRWSIHVWDVAKSKCSSYMIKHRVSLANRITTVEFGEAIEHHINRCSTCLHEYIHTA